MFDPNIVMMDFPDLGEREIHKDFKEVLEKPEYKD